MRTRVSLFLEGGAGTVSKSKPHRLLAPTSSLDSARCDLPIVAVIVSPTPPFLAAWGPAIGPNLNHNPRLSSEAASLLDSTGGRASGAQLRTNDVMDLGI